MKPNHENILTIGKIEEDNCGGLMIIIDSRSKDMVNKEQISILIREYMPKSKGTIYFRETDAWGNITQNWDYFLKNGTKEELEKSVALLIKLKESILSNKQDNIVYQNTTLIKEQQNSIEQPIMTRFPLLGSQWDERNYEPILGKESNIISNIYPYILTN